jgi:hypothetical protein
MEIMDYLEKSHNKTRKEGLDSDAFSRLVDARNQLEQVAPDFIYLDSKPEVEQELLSKQGSARKDLDPRLHHRHVVCKELAAKLGKSPTVGATDKANSQLYVSGVRSVDTSVVYGVILPLPGMSVRACSASQAYGLYYSNLCIYQLCPPELYLKLWGLFCILAHSPSF